MYIITLVVCLLSPPVLCATQLKSVTTPPQKRPGVVAQVNGVELSVDDYDRELVRIERALLDTGNPLTPSRIVKLRAEVVENLIVMELLYRESKGKIEVKDSEVEEEIRKLKTKYPTEDVFMSALNTMKVTPASLKTGIEREISVRKYIDAEFSSKTHVTEEEVRSF
jgi:hypothetical protein